ncbi:MAG: hypothetical protein KatS3mg026_1683 [Bacteroidia bacterium]|nr:MAG: hypothetical protein KatS3mg026_1683 [Bacteroidia bacterium]
MDARSRILEAAIQEFAQYGYDGARLERIARAAQVHTAQIHYYFRSKKGLYEAVQAHLQPPSLEEVMEPLKAADLPLPQRVQEFYRRFYTATQALGWEGGNWALLPPLLRDPRALEMAPWIEALTQAQQVGLVRRWPLRFVLSLQWSLAMEPLWYAFPPEAREKHYLEEAPRLFWEAVKAIP